jgi:hypothetical protein
LKNHKILDKWRLLYRILSFSFSWDTPLLFRRKNPSFSDSVRLLA